MNQALLGKMQARICPALEAFALQGMLGGPSRCTEEAAGMQLGPFEYSIANSNSVLAVVMHCTLSQALVKGRMRKMSQEGHACTPLTLPVDPKSTPSTMPRRMPVT